MNEKIEILLHGTMRAIAFLSRIPVSGRFFDPERIQATARDTPFYALAGIAIAIPAALSLAVTHFMTLPDLVCAFAAIATLLVTTGALHEDGLADVADGIGAGRDRERRLAIMKDSQIGTFGALALMVSVGIRVAALSAILSVHGTFAAIMALVAASAVSRAAMCYPWNTLSNIRSGGTADLAGKPDDTEAATCMIIGAIAFIAIGTAATGFVPMATGALLASVATLSFNAYVRKALGGYTGDVLGATQQCAEIAALCGLAMQFSLTT